MISNITYQSGIGHASKSMNQVFSQRSNGTGGLSRAFSTPGKVHFSQHCSQYVNSEDEDNENIDFSNFDNIPLSQPYESDTSEKSDVEDYSKKSKKIKENPNKKRRII